VNCGLRTTPAASEYRCTYTGPRDSHQLAVSIRRRALAHAMSGRRDFEVDLVRSSSSPPDLAGVSFGGHPGIVRIRRLRVAVCRECRSVPDVRSRTGRRSSQSRSRKVAAATVNASCDLTRFGMCAESAVSRSLPTQGIQQSVPLQPPLYNLVSSHRCAGDFP